MAKNQKRKTQLGEPATAVSEKAFLSLAQAYNGEDYLIAAFNYRDGIWVFAGSLNRLEQEPEFYLGPYSHPGRDGLHTTPIETFLESNREELRKFRLTSMVGRMEEYEQSIFPPGRLLTEMRSHWTTERYNRNKNEQEEFNEWLRTSNHEKERITSTEGTTPSVDATPPSVSKIGKSSQQRRRALDLTIFLSCLPVALICGYLFGSRIDNASPVDGAMIGAVMGFVLYLLIVNWGCGAMKTGFLIGLGLTLLMFCIGHIQGYRMERDRIEARDNREYKDYLSDVLMQEDAPIFIAHLRAMAKSGTAAVEKPFAYMPGQWVVRQGWEVWLAWVGQVLWCVFFTWIGVFFGYERHLARNKSAK